MIEKNQNCVDSSVQSLLKLTNFRDRRVTSLIQQRAIKANMDNDITAAVFIGGSTARLWAQDTSDLDVVVQPTSSQHRSIAFDIFNIVEAACRQADVRISEIRTGAFAGEILIPISTLETWDGSVANLQRFICQNNGALIALD